MQSNGLSKLIAAAQTENKGESTKVNLYNFFINRSMSAKNEKMLREYSRKMSEHYLESFYDYPKIPKTEIKEELKF
jgi:hypothetical protein